MNHTDLGMFLRKLFKDEDIKIKIKCYYRRGREYPQSYVILEGEDNESYLSSLRGFERTGGIL